MSAPGRTDRAARRRCPTCGSAAPDGLCPSAVCRLPDRWLSRVHTVSERTEETWATIRRYKYDDQRHLAEELGALLVDYLRAHRERVARYDVLALTALYTGPRAARLWDYLRLVADAAERLDPRWRFASDVVVKDRPTGRFLGLGVAERREIAEGELRDALRVPDPGRVAGKRVLVLDDAWSEGFTLREMARALREAGAAEVAGLVLVRRKGA